LKLSYKRACNFFAVILCFSDFSPV